MIEKKNRGFSLLEAVLVSSIFFGSLAVVFQGLNISTKSVRYFSEKTDSISNLVHLLKNIENESFCTDLIRTIGLNKTSPYRFRGIEYEVLLKESVGESLHSLQFLKNGTPFFETKLEIDSSSNTCGTTESEVSSILSNNNNQLDCGDNKLLGFNVQNGNLNKICSSPLKKDEFEVDGVKYCHGKTVLRKRDRSTCNVECEIEERIECQGKDNIDCSKDIETACHYRNSLIKLGETEKFHRNDVCKNGDGQCIPDPEALNFCHIEKYSECTQRPYRCREGFRHNTYSNDEIIEKSFDEKYSHTCPANRGCHPGLQFDSFGPISSLQQYASSHEFNEQRLCVQTNLVPCENSFGQTWSCRFVHTMLYVKKK